MGVEAVLKKMFWVAMVFCALVLVGFAVGAWLFFKRPLTVDAYMSRFALKNAGLVPSTIDAPAGPMTVWEGGVGGTTMLLLHGAGDQAGAWARVVPQLKDDYHLLIPDMPGHWKSAPTEGPIHVQQLLGGVEAVMDARVGDEPAILVGNSMGGWMAALYAQRHPARVARLVLVNGGPLSNVNTEVNLFPKTRQEAEATMKALLGPETPMPPGFVLDHVIKHSAAGPAARFAATADEMMAWVLDGRLAELTVPTELVWGTADGLMTMAYAQQLVAELPRARLHPVEDCGHVPHRECPFLMAGALKRALAEEPLPLEAGISPAGDAAVAP